MRATTLLYHDVVPEGQLSSSGFPGADANLYKLDRSQFAAHLDAVGRVLSQPPATVWELTPSRVMLAFDDGGASAFDSIAPMLEQRGWRGHFFIPTDWIGRPGFLTAAQIRELHQRGHVIGSHSCSHPARMSSLPSGQIFEEWTRSLAILSEIAGTPITAASVPAGYYSTTVGQEAGRAGVQALFHSEPVTEAGELGGVLLFGRYSIQRATPPATAAAIAAGAFLPRVSQYTYWQAKKVLKRAGGDAWLRFRKQWFASQE